MKFTDPPAVVWVFMGVDGNPCLVQTSEPRDDDFDHPFERAFRYAVLDSEPRRRTLEASQQSGGDT